MQELETELKEMIVSALELEDVAPADIDSNAPLFGEGLGLDSIDALELALALSKKYGVNLKADDEDTPKIFASVSALARYVNDNRSA